MTYRELFDRLKMAPSHWDDKIRLDPQVTGRMYEIAYIEMQNDKLVLVIDREDG